MNAKEILQGLKKPVPEYGKRLKEHMDNIQWNAALDEAIAALGDATNRDLEKTWQSIFDGVTGVAAGAPFGSGWQVILNMRDKESCAELSQQIEKFLEF